MSTEFQWNDETVLEFVQFTLKNSPLLQGRRADIKQFKENKQPKIMFTTSDGVDIAIGDRYYYVTREFNSYLDTCDSLSGGKFVSGTRVGDVYFSTEAAAEDFILENKPLLSLKEILSVGNTGENNPYYKKLVDIAKSKLK